MLPNSPLFPPLSLVQSSPGNNHGVADEIPTFMPQLPDAPTAQTASVQVYIIPAEPNLFVEGFEQREFSERPPTLLRGCLYIRVLKPLKIRSIQLVFKGQERTDWPEGIPPKKSTFMEINDIVSHTWPFYQLGTANANNGADTFSELPKSIDHDASHSNWVGMEPITSNNSSPGPAEGSFFSRTLSPSFIRRAISPSPSRDDLASLNPDEGLFAVGDYVYNFEHPLRPSIPESCSVTFGEVSYFLEASITRIGAFKLNITARLPVNIIRVPSTNNMEENEPIVITRDWEDQLRYDIVIGSKSIVLDSYLPLAFRFVPLWGKVALHRIRVYLTENLEYYCQNKKVHRMEPAKKFLLLEHKASKGKSLLAAEEGPPDEENLEDELLPKELEFQLFVPLKLTDKLQHEIHPNTSLDNIQLHHWIKICLRILRKDPKNPEKRKHYEILIDSPLRILSPLAAHANTLLPAYDNGVPLNIPVFAPSTPPLSPGVSAVSHRNTLDSMVDNVDPFDTNSPVRQTRPRDSSAASLSSLSAIPRPSTPEFLHIRSQNNNDGAIERDADMHLGANLYSPSGQSDLTLSPQAVPHPDTFTSPINSPVQRPIHLLRKPSFNPPNFDADAPPPSILVEQAPPPAYEDAATYRGRSPSLSPLRIDGDQPSYPPLFSSPSLFDGADAAPSPPLPTEAPIKDLLSRQLQNSRRPLVSNDSASTSTSTLLAGSRLSDPEASEQSSQNSRDVPAPSVASSEDLYQVPLATSTLIPSEQTENSNPALVQNSSSASEVPVIALDTEPSESSSEPIDEGGLDLTDYLGSPAPDSTIRSHSPMRRINSRRSSRSSEDSADSDSQRLEQQIPLLNFSLSSINSQRSEDYDPFSNSNFVRNGLVNSLHYDFERRVSHPQLHSTNMMDLVGGEDLGATEVYKQAITGNLLGLRNPRIKRHYQYPEQLPSGSDILGSIIKSPVGEETEHSDRSSEESQFTIRKEQEEETAV